MLVYIMAAADNILYTALYPVLLLEQLHAEQQVAALETDGGGAVEARVAAHRRRRPAQLARLAEILGAVAGGEP